MRCVRVGLNLFLITGVLFFVPVFGANGQTLAFRGIDFIPTSENSYGSTQAQDKIKFLKENLNINTVSIRQYITLPQYDNPSFSEDTQVTLDEIQEQIIFNKS